MSNLAYMRMPGVIHIVLSGQNGPGQKLIGPPDRSCPSKMVRVGPILSIKINPTYTKAVLP